MQGYKHRAFIHENATRLLLVVAARRAEGASLAPPAELEGKVPVKGPLGNYSFYLIFLFSLYN